MTDVPLKIRKELYNQNQLCSIPECGRWLEFNSAIPHHIKSKGAWGNNHSLGNLLQVCLECHNNIHMGKISREKVQEIKEKNEKRF